MLPLVVKIEQVDGGVRRYAFADSPVSVGRSPFAELQLSEPFISRWEGTLRFDEGEITYFSLGETNATYLDGKSIPAGDRDIALGVESVLSLGELKLRFAREPVAESDLRRKGKRRPTREGADMGVKTVYLDAADAWSPPPPAAATTPPVSERQLLAAASGAIHGQSSASTVGDHLHGLVPVHERGHDHGLDHDHDNAQSATAAATRKTTTHAGAADTLTSLRRGYREARATLLLEVRAQLAAHPEGERTAWLSDFIQLEPVLASEPELQAELERRGLRAPQEIPELREWLRAIKSDLLPDHVHFDTRLTLTRVLGLVEALVQSLAEINDAQESVRRRWLGRSSRRSPIQSEQGNIVLSYLLNPHADWNERLRELEQSVRDVVSHELALFRATLDGARTLIGAVSPETIEQAAAESGELKAKPNLLERLFDKHLAEAQLWRRSITTHAELVDGARYERVFLGRSFARSYLAAMGRNEDTAKTAS